MYQNSFNHDFILNFCMKLELRKKIYRSGQSLQVTLPAVWWRNHNLRAGNYVSLTIAEDGKLIIDPKKNEK